MKKRKFIKRLIAVFLTGVIFLLTASFVLDTVEEKRQIKAQLENISNVYIGCNKDWADEAFGTPEFIGNKDEYTLCAYVTDYYVLQIAYDNAGSACGYLITALENEDNLKIKIEDDTYINREEEKGWTLGELTYYDFPGQPVNVSGFVSNGSGRIMYSEHYYFASSGGYYDYYLATLDYGIGLNESDMAYLAERKDIDDEVSADMIDGLQVINRKNCGPNSYGVSNLDHETFSKLLLDYSWFNSQQLRNRYSKGITE